MYEYTIKELIALHELEPELNDVYVEGITDKLVIERYIDKYNIDDVSVKAVEEINFEEINEHYPQIKKNNKEKLIALSDLLNKSKKFEKINGITIVLDKDFDQITESLLENKLVKYYDYNSLELYLYNEQTIKNFYKNILRRFPHNANETIKTLTPILIDCFILSFVFHEKGYGKKSRVDYTNSIEIKKKKNEHIVSFSFNEHLVKNLNKNQIKNQEKEFSKRIQNLRNTIQETDYRNSIVGHDFIKIFYYYVDKIKNTIKLNLDTFERSFFQCIDYSNLKEEEFFKYLEAKYT